MRRSSSPTWTSGRKSVFRLASLLRRALRDDAAAAALEFAFICPLIFVATLGTLESGRALYERNKLQTACAAGVRALAIHGPGDEDAIRAAINARFTEAEQDRLDIDIDDETIGGADFKKLELTYVFNPLINFGHHFGELNFIVTRYAPAIVIAEE